MRSIGAKGRGIGPRCGASLREVRGYPGLEVFVRHQALEGVGRVESEGILDSALTHCSNNKFADKYMTTSKAHTNLQ